MYHSKCMKCVLQIKEYWNLKRMQQLYIAYVIHYNQKYMKGHFTLFIAFMDRKC